MKTRFIIYSGLVVYVLVCLLLIHNFRSEVRIYESYDGCGIKGCQNDIYYKTSEHFMNNYVAKNYDSNSYFVQIDNSLHNLIKYKIYSDKSEQIVWIQKSRDGYKWSVAYKGSDDRSFLEGLEN
jgi:hypothetical protein